MELIRKPEGKDRDAIGSLVTRYWSERYLVNFFDSRDEFVVVRDSSGDIVFFQAADCRILKTPFHKKEIPVITFQATAKSCSESYSNQSFFYYCSLKLGPLQKYLHPFTVISKQTNPNICEHIPRTYFTTYSDYHQNMDGPILDFLNAFYDGKNDAGLYPCDDLKGLEIVFPDAIKYIPKSKRLLAYFLDKVYRFDKDKIVLNGNHQITVSYYHPFTLLKNLLLGWTRRRSTRSTS